MTEKKQRKQDIPFDSKLKPGAQANKDINQDLQISKMELGGKGINKQSFENSLQHIQSKQAIYEEYGGKSPSSEQKVIRNQNNYFSKFEMESGPSIQIQCQENQSDQQETINSSKVSNIVNHVNSFHNLLRPFNISMNMDSIKLIETQTRQKTDSDEQRQISDESQRFDPSGQRITIFTNDKSGFQTPQDIEIMHRSRPQKLQQAYQEAINQKAYYDPYSQILGLKPVQKGLQSQQNILQSQFQTFGDFSQLSEKVKHQKYLLPNSSSRQQVIDRLGLKTNNFSYYKPDPHRSLIAQTRSSDNQLVKDQNKCSLNAFNEQSRTQIESQTFNIGISVDFAQKHKTKKSNTGMNSYLQNESKDRQEPIESQPYQSSNSLLPSMKNLPKSRSTAKVMSINQKTTQAYESYTRKPQTSNTIMNDLLKEKKSQFMLKSHGGAPDLSRNFRNFVSSNSNHKILYDASSDQFEKSHTFTQSNKVLFYKKDDSINASKSCASIIPQEQLKSPKNVMIPDSVNQLLFQASKYQTSQQKQNNQQSNFMQKHQLFKIECIRLQDEASKFFKLLQQRSLEVQSKGSFEVKHEFNAECFSSNLELAKQAISFTSIQQIAPRVVQVLDKSLSQIEMHQAQIELYYKTQIKDLRKQLALQVAATNKLQKVITNEHIAEEEKRKELKNFTNDLSKKMDQRIDDYMKHPLKFTSEDSAFTLDDIITRVMSDMDKTSYSGVINNLESLSEQCVLLTVATQHASYKQTSADIINEILKLKDGQTQNFVEDETNTDPFETRIGKFVKHQSVAKEQVMRKVLEFLLSRRPGVNVETQTDDIHLLKQNDEVLEAKQQLGGDQESISITQMSILKAVEYQKKLDVQSVRLMKADEEISKLKLELQKYDGYDPIQFQELRQQNYKYMVEIDSLKFNMQRFQGKEEFYFKKLCQKDKQLNTLKTSLTQSQNFYLLQIKSYHQVYDQLKNDMEDICMNFVDKEYTQAQMEKISQAITEFEKLNNMAIGQLNEKWEEVEQTAKKIKELKIVTDQVQKDCKAITKSFENNSKALSQFIVTRFEINNKCIVYLTNQMENGKTDREQKQQKIIDQMYDILKQRNEGLQTHQVIYKEQNKSIVTKPSYQNSSVRKQSDVDMLSTVRSKVFHTKQPSNRIQNDDIEENSSITQASAPLSKQMTMVARLNDDSHDLNKSTLRLNQDQSKNSILKISTTDKSRQDTKSNVESPLAKKFSNNLINNQSGDKTFSQRDVPKTSKNQTQEETPSTQKKQKQPELSSFTRATPATKNKYISNEKSSIYQDQTQVSIIQKPKLTSPMGSEDKMMNPAFSENKLRPDHILNYYSKIDEQDNEFNNFKQILDSQRSRVMSKSNTKNFQIKIEERDGDQKNSKPLRGSQMNAQRNVQIKHASRDNQTNTDFHQQEQANQILKSLLESTVDTAYLPTNYSPKKVQVLKYETPLLTIENELNRFQNNSLYFRQEVSPRGEQTKIQRKIEERAQSIAEKNFKDKQKANTVSVAVQATLTQQNPRKEQKNKVIQTDDIPLAQIASFIESFKMSKHFLKYSRHRTDGIVADPSQWNYKFDPGQNMSHVLLEGDYKKGDYSLELFDTPFDRVVQTILEKMISTQSIILPERPQDSGLIQGSQDQMLEVKLNKAIFKGTQPISVTVASDPFVQTKFGQKKGFVDTLRKSSEKQTLERDNRVTDRNLNLTQLKQNNSIKVKAQKGVIFDFNDQSKSSNPDLYSILNHF